MLKAKGGTCRCFFDEQQSTRRERGQPRRGNARFRTYSADQGALHRLVFPPQRTRTLNQQELFSEDTSGLFDRLCDPHVLKHGFKSVRRNGGSPGIDGITIESYKADLEQEIRTLSAELKGWEYAPQPVRRVEIPKPGGKGVRLLGVPCVRDRVVQASIKNLLEPLIAPTFSESSYGFRPVRSQKQAIEKAKSIVQSGKEYVVDIDLSKFFDRVNHDKLIERLKIRYSIDNRILRLIGLTLRSGVMVDGRVEATRKGTTQGSPLSPQAGEAIHIYYYQYRHTTDEMASVQSYSANIEKHITGLEELMRLRHYSPSTEKAYMLWTKRFLNYGLETSSGGRPDREDLKSFLTHLAVVSKVSSSTQNQAFNALLLFFREILHEDLKDLGQSVRARRGKRLPTVLSVQEVQELFKFIDSDYKLMVMLLYGSGLRLMELLCLRVKDLDFDAGIIMVRSGKGDNDRVTILPSSLELELKEQIEKVRKLHERDLSNGFGEAPLPHALERKDAGIGKKIRLAISFSRRQGGC